MTKKKKITYSPPNLHSVNNSELACLDGSSAQDDVTCDTGTAPDTACNSGNSAVYSGLDACELGGTAYSTDNAACAEGTVAADPGTYTCTSGGTPGASPCLTGSGAT